MSEPSHRLLEPNLQKVLYALTAVGVGAFALGLFQDPVRAWHALLLNNFFFFSMALMGIAFLAINTLVKSGWTTVIRRIPESFFGYLPVGGALMLVMLFGLSRIYHWAEPHAAEHDAILQAKSAYLNPGAFSIRAVLFVVLWIALSRALIVFSRRQDEDGDLKWTGKSMRVSAVFVVLFALTFTLASVDWLMSLEPHWYSTLFPWYVMSSSFAASLCLITLIAILLRERGQFQELGQAHLHDLGKYVFAFSVFWGYLWFSQYLLIWYSHIPEETTHYIARSGEWYSIFALNPIINLGLPFVLLPARNKLKVRLMITVCVALIFGHWLDFFQLVMPSATPEGPRFGIIDLGVAVGVGSVFLLSVDRALRSSPLIPKGDPYLEESLAHHG